MAYFKNRSSTKGKIPCGFDAKMPDLNDDGSHYSTTEEEAWSRLDDIQVYLADRKPIPEELAHWLFGAIESSQRDPVKFLQSLGLKRRKGEKGPYNRSFKEHWQGRLWDLGTYRLKRAKYSYESQKEFENYDCRSLSASKIVELIQDEMIEQKVENFPNRQTLQDWFNEIMGNPKRSR